MQYEITSDGKTKASDDAQCPVLAITDRAVVTLE